MRLLTVFWMFISCLYGQELTFERSRQEISVAADQTRLIVDFKFTNNTLHSAEIVSYEAKCPCLAAQVEDGKLIYAPGEGGVVRGVFDLQNFTGVVEKNIQIWMRGDAKEKPSIALVVSVTIPEKLHLEPVSLSWALGEAPEEKVMTIRIAEDEPMEVLSISGGTERFSAKIEEVEESKVYRLKVKPISTERVGMATLRLRTSSENFRFSKRNIFVMVKK